MCNRANGAGKRIITDRKSATLAAALLDVMTTIEGVLFGCAAIPAAALRWECPSRDCESAVVPYCKRARCVY